MLLQYIKTRRYTTHPVLTTLIMNDDYIPVEYYFSSICYGPSVKKLQSPDTLRGLDRCMTKGASVVCKIHLPTLACFRKFGM